MHILNDGQRKSGTGYGSLVKHPSGKLRRGLPCGSVSNSNNHNGERSLLTGSRLSTLFSLLSVG